MSKLTKNLHRYVPTLGKACVGALLIGSALTSCSDMDEYFETPSWLRGSVYETLSSDGNYSIFLAGVDKAGYQPLLQGKAIVTVMAPTDDKMQEYLLKNYGTTDISQLSDDEVSKLIGFHVLYYSFDKENLINFRPNEGDGATEDESNVDAGLYYKFRTRSKDAISQETGYVIDETTGDTTQMDVSVYHQERYLPVFSWRMFRTKDIDAAKNYNYFFPGAWKDNSGFNVSNAGVDEYGVITSNGYIYRVNEVLKPLETIYTELKNRSEFSRYFSMYDKYSNYVLDSEDTETYGNGTNLYLHMHNMGANLAPIALEWPVTSYKDVSSLAKKSYSVFAFSNQAFETFFNEYWGYGGYESPDDPDLSSSVLDLLMNSYYSQSIVFPEEVKRGDILNNDGEAIDIDTAAVAQENRVICANGVLYGCGNIIPPAKYNSVTGPAYQYKQFTYFLNFLKSSGLTNTLSEKSIKHIMLFPTNEQMTTAEGITTNAVGDIIKVQGNTQSSIGSSVKSSTVYAHVATPEDENTVLPTSGKAVYTALNADKKVYWYVKDGKITNSIRLAASVKYAANTITEDKVWAKFSPLAYRGDVDGWTNGRCYQYDNLLFHGGYEDDPYLANNPAFISLMASQNTDSSTEFYGWFRLLLKSGLATAAGKISALNDESCLMFVPLTEALEKAIVAGEVPGITASDATVGSADFFDNCTVEDKSVLQAYLLSYFVPLSSAVISNYPYVGWGEDTASQGGLTTMDKEETLNDAGDFVVTSTNLNIYDDGSKLSVSRVNRDKVESTPVEVSNNYDYFPLTFSDGPVQFLNSVLPAINGK